MLLFIVSLLSLISSAQSVTYAQRDVVNNLPGLTYQLNFKHYSGYLKASPGNNLHYWLVESQSNPSTDPLILWLNGGPGCSSLLGLFTELGPFFPNPGGATLFENVFSWNKKANLLFIEAPRNVGFSYQNYSVNQDPNYDDHRTKWDNFLAVKDFFTNYPNYQTSQFYVTGESYGGVYVPTLTDLLIKQIQAHNLTANLVGMAVGNGILSIVNQLNSAVDILYFHGIYGKSQWDALKACCPANQSLSYCDFSKYVTFDSGGNAIPIDNSTCAKLVEQLGFDMVWLAGNNPYNLYQDCYQLAPGPGPLLSSDFASATATGFVDFGSKLNWVSTDGQAGFPCYSMTATVSYLAMPSVRTALNIPNAVPTWNVCNFAMNGNYSQQNHVMMPVFTSIINSGYKLKMMVYNGDVGTVCNFLGDEWFIEALNVHYNMTITVPRRPWFYSLASQYQSQLAGYNKGYAYNNVTIELVTVKGAGHMVPTDRPGPALQMITNFINGNNNFNTSTGYGIARKPLLPKYQNHQAKDGRVVLASISSVLLVMLVRLLFSI